MLPVISLLCAKGLLPALAEADDGFKYVVVSGFLVMELKH